MSVPAIPHLSLPLRVQGDRFATVEQDTLTEISQCVETVLRYRQGQRSELPAFGIPEQAFRENGADTDELQAAVARWEPRAKTALEASEIVDMAQTVGIEVSENG